MGTMTLTANVTPSVLQYGGQGSFTVSGAPTGNVIIDSYSVTIIYNGQLVSPAASYPTVGIAPAPYGLNSFILSTGGSPITKSQTYSAGFVLSTDANLGSYANGKYQLTLGGLPGRPNVLTVLSIVVSIVYHTATVNEPNTTTPKSTPPATPSVPVPPLGATFVSVPPATANYDSNYTLTIDLTRNGVRDPNVAGTVSVTAQMTTFSGTSLSDTSWTKDGGAAANTQTITVAEGRATATIQIPSSGHTDGVYYFKVNSINSIPLNGLSPAFRIGTTNASPSAAVLKFTSQPSSLITLGTVVSAVVSVISDTGTVNTGWIKDVLLTLEYADGTAAPTTWLTGTTTVTAVAGVATFNGLVITQPGRFRLRASVVIAEDIDTAYSTLITIQGEPVPGDIIGLRQNVRDDGTLVVGTTSYPTVSANPAISAAEKGYFDGDLASANNKVLHGIRYVTPFPIVLEKVVTKFKLSSIANAPLIRVLYSLDTTTGVDGTWTLLTSYTVPSTLISLRTFVFSVPQMCKGVWVTLDQNGGAATCTWYAFHVFGGYVGSNVSYLNTGSLAIDNEGVLSIPTPVVPINVAVTKYRELTLRNNTSSDIILGMSVEPARSDGDAAVEDTVAVVDSNGNYMPSSFVLPGYGTKDFKLRYRGLSAPTALDGDHLVRVSLRSATEADARGVSVGTGIQSISTSLTGTLQISKSDSNIQTLCAMLTPGGNTLVAVGYNTTATNLTRFIYHGSTIARMDITAPVTESEYTRIFPLTKKTGYVTRNSTGAVYRYDITESNMTEVAWLATSGRTVFTLPSTTAGPKTMMPGRGDRIWIANGRGADSKIYEYDVYGALLTTLTLSTNLSGLSLDCHCYDTLNDEVYVITQPVAGTRKISRYNAATGAFIASVNNSDEGGAGTAEGCSTLGLYLYVYYNSRYLNRYDIQTLANNVRKYDNGAASYADSNWKGFL